MTAFLFWYSAMTYLSFSSVSRDRILPLLI